MPAHQHESLGISIVLRGVVEETVGRSAEQAAAGTLVVKPAGTVHANRFGPTGARLLSVALHPVRAEELLRGNRGLSRWRWIRAVSSLRIAAQAVVGGSSARHLRGEEAERLVLHLLDLVGSDDGSSTEGVAPAWLLAVRERLHAEHAVPCRVRDLARDAAVHPVYLARRFRAHFGCSVTSYLRRIRVRAAAAALGDAADPIASVAVGAGFADQSHLCRVFRAMVGVTPGGYRALAAGGVGPPPA